MENIVIRNIRYILAIVSALLTYSLVYFGGFPFAGIAISFLTIGSLLFFFKSGKTFQNTGYFLIVVLLSLFLVLRANPLLTFFNIVGLFYFLSELLLDIKGDSLLIHIFSPFTAVTKTLSEKIERKEVKLPKVNIDKHIPAIIISFLVLLVIVPLLASANPIFNSLVTKLFDFEFLNKIIVENLALNLVRLFVFTVLLFLLPRALSITQKNISLNVSEFEESLYQAIYTIPKIAVIVVLSVFFVTQLQLYFSTEDTLIALGYTNSEYAREVFGQLSVVTLITFLLIFFDRAKNATSKITTSILLLQMVFLNLMAYKSVYDYTSNWGYTIKRLYGYTVVFWLFALLATFTYVYFKKKSYRVFLDRIIILTGVTLLLVNIINFDKLIYHKSQSVTHHGIDYFYLSTLSTDSQSLREQLNILKEIQADNANPENVSSTLAFLEIKVRYLQNKYEDFDWRTFNLSDYREYLSVKDYALPDNGKAGTSETIEDKQSIPDGSVKVVIQNLPHEFRNNPYYLAPTEQESVPLRNRNFTSKLEDNTFIVDGGPGEYYLYILNEKTYYSRYSLSTTEVPFIINDTILSQRELTITY